MKVPLLSLQRYWAVAWGTTVTSFLVASTVVATDGPLPDPITKTELSVIAKDFVRMPQSGSPYARINFLREEPGGADRLFVNDLNGKFYTVHKTTKAVTTYMNFTSLFPFLKRGPGLASGLVTFALDPDFAANGKFYTVHSETATSHEGATETPVIAPPLGNYIQASVLTEWVASNPLAPTFSGTQREIMRIGTPDRFHPMGDLGFNPLATQGDDDYGRLYIAIGDGQSFDIPSEIGNLQRLDSYLGTILRIDPDPTNVTSHSALSGNGEYRIPNNNPWASDNDTDPNTFGEIYAYGFRNPHRITWDSVTGAMFSTDIGQGEVEEVNLVQPGRNYGWSAREGTFLEGGAPLPANDATFGFTYPVAQYDHDEGFAIAGGFAYRGTKIPVLQGKFVFGDLNNGRIFYSDLDEMIAADDGDPSTTAAISELQLIHDGVNKDLIDIVSDALGNTAFRTDLRLGADSDGELYLMTKQDGWIRELLPRLSSDFDRDGDVDSEDLARWQAGFGIGTTNVQGDADGDSDVDGGDFLVWQRQFNSGAAALSGVAVPEPTSFGLLAIAGLMVFTRAISRSPA